MNSTRAADASSQAVSPEFIRSSRSRRLPSNRGATALPSPPRRLPSVHTREPGAHRAEREGWKPPTVEPDPGNAGAGREWQRMEIGRLHVIVNVSPARDWYDLARRAVDGGAPVLQLRAKDATDREAFDMAVRLGDLCRQRGAMLVVDDRLDVAVAAGADGV